MTKQLNTNQLERLAEIKEEVLVLLSEALDLVRGTPRSSEPTTGSRPSAQR